MGFGRLRSRNADVDFPGKQLAHKVNDGSVYDRRDGRSGLQVLR